MSDFKGKEADVAVAPLAIDVETAAEARLVKDDFEILHGCKSVLIKQKFHALEAAAQAIGLGCIEVQNEYNIFHPDTGEHLLVVKEKSDPLQRCCFNPCHEAHLTYTDARTNNIAMIGHKPFKCGCCCAFHDICRWEMDSRLPSGESFANAKVPFGGGGFTPTIETMDRSGNKTGEFKGPTLITGGLIELCTELSFTLHNTKGEIVGHVQKKKPSDFKGLGTELISDSDIFQLTFPEDASDEHKMALVNNAILIDYIFYENGKFI